jgi:hypothetical protein
MQRPDARVDSRLLHKKPRQKSCVPVSLSVKTQLVDRITSIELVERFNACFSFSYEECNDCNFYSTVSAFFCARRTLALQHSRKMQIQVMFSVSKAEVW